MWSHAGPRSLSPCPFLCPSCGCPSPEVFPCGARCFRGIDIEPILRDIFGFVGWSKTPDSRKWGHPTCKPKKGDLAVFASKKNDADFSHVTLIASPAGEIYSLEPNASGAPAALRNSHVNVYLSEPLRA